MPVRTWSPAGDPEAVIIALHGFNDYGRAFDLFGPWAARHGVFVEAYDQQGFGQTENRGFWAGVDTLSSDLHDRIRLRRRQFPDVPIYVLGESMGAAVAVVAMTEPDAPSVDGVILASPAVWGGDTFNPIYRIVLWSVVQIAPGWQLTGRQLKIQASDNIDMLRELGRDPLVMKATRVDAIAGLVELMDIARERTPELNLPVLVLSGARDEVVVPEIQESFIAELTAQPCLAVVYPDGWHMLLRDLQREVVWRDILSWVRGGGIESTQQQTCGRHLLTSLYQPALGRDTERK